MTSTVASGANLTADNVSHHNGEPPRVKAFWELVFEKFDTPYWAYLKPHQAILDQNRDDMLSHGARELFPLQKREVAGLILNSAYKYCDPTDAGHVLQWRHNVMDMGHMYLLAYQKEIVFADAFDNTLWGKKDDEQVREVVMDLLEHIEVTKYGRSANLPFITRALNVWINGMIQIEPFMIPEAERIQIENFHPSKDARSSI